MRGIVSRVSQTNGILSFVKRIFVDTSVLLRCYFPLFSQSLSIVLRCGGQLLQLLERQVHGKFTLTLRSSMVSKWRETKIFSIVLYKRSI